MIHVTRTDRSLTVALADDGTPATAEAVEAAWRDWVRANPDLPRFTDIEDIYDGSTWLMRITLAAQPTAKIAPPPSPAAEFLT